MIKNVLISIGLLHVASPAIAQNFIDEISNYSDKVQARRDNIYLDGSTIASIETSDNGTESVEFHHGDASLTRISSTSAEGSVLRRTNYAAYGSRDQPTSGSIGYAGHIEDADSGLVYMQQRYYDPQIGSFVSVDPEAVSTSTGWNFCRYCYAASNPYKFIDPDGRAVQALWGAPVGAIVDIVAQKIANPDASINWKSVGVSAALGAVTGGVASVARVAAIRGSVTVGQAVVGTAATNAALGAAGSAVDSAVNGEPLSTGKMAIAAAANGGLSLTAGLSGAKGMLAEKMAAARPTSPQGIGNHIVSTTQTAGRSGGTSAVQGAASAGGRVAEIAKETGVSTIQKKAEDRIN